MRLALAAAAALFAGSTAAHAVIVGGGVTLVDELISATPPTSGFIKLTVPFGDSTPANTVGDDTFDTPFLYGFDEDQNVSAPSEISVDIGAPVPEGEIVASHYVFIDPGPLTRIVGFVDFDAPIYGVATSRDRLNATDFLANTGVAYLSPGARGLETASGQLAPTDDVVSIDPTDPFRLLVDLAASDPGDYVRVFTRFSPTADSSPVPLPAAGWGLIAGLGALGGLAARRRRGG